MAQSLDSDAVPMEPLDVHREGIRIIQMHLESQGPDWRAALAKLQAAVPQ